MVNLGAQREDLNGMSGVGKKTRYKTKIIILFYASCYSTRTSQNFILNDEFLNIK